MPTIADCCVYLSLTTANLHGHYPQQDAIKKAKSVYRDILLYKANETKLLERIRDQEEDLLNAKDDAEEIVSFFNGKQKGIYDNATRRFQFFSDDSQYIAENPEAVEAYNAIKEILTMEKPFQKIAELPNCVQILENKHVQTRHFRNKADAGSDKGLP